MKFATMSGKSGRVRFKGVALATRAWPMARASTAPSNNLFSKRISTSGSPDPERGIQSAVEGSGQLASQVSAIFEHLWQFVCSPTHDRAPGRRPPRACLAGYREARRPGSSKTRRAAMKLLWFHLMPYTDLPDDFAERYGSVWVDIDPALF